MAAETFASRFWSAYKDLEKREGRVPQAVLAQRIREEGGFPTRQDDVSRWIKGTGRPETEELPAIARVLGVGLMELAFGQEPIEPGSLLGAPLTNTETLVRPEDVEPKTSRRKRG